MATYSIKEGQYNTKEDVIVEIITPEIQITSESRTEITEKQILGTIAVLDARIADIQSEKDTNIQLLEKIRELNASVELVPNP